MEPNSETNVHQNKMHEKGIKAGIEYLTDQRIPSE
jgi:hypothetical protein